MTINDKKTLAKDWGCKDGINSINEHYDSIGEPAIHVEYKEFNG
jgi:hypothetical protein